MKITKSGLEWFTQDFDPQVLMDLLSDCAVLQSGIAREKQDAERLAALLTHLEVEDGLPEGSISALTNATWDANERKHELEYVAKAKINAILEGVSLFAEYVYYWGQGEFTSEVNFIRQQQADRGMSDPFC